MNKLFFVSLIIVTITLYSQIATSDSVSIDILVKNFKNDSGVARLLMFSNDEGFPGEMDKAVFKRSSGIENNISNFTIKVPNGEYAVVILHDENNNGEIDKAWYGKPIEGFGVSNNPKSSFGPPDYEDSTIFFKEGSNSIIIKMRYF